jgi:hypothetical protein
MEATDAAAATASIIFYQVFFSRWIHRIFLRTIVLQSRENDDPYYSRSRSRRSSFSSSPYDDPYSYDDRLMFPHSDPYHRSHSRPHSRVRTYSHSSAHAPIPYASSAVPIPIHSGGVVPTGYAGSYNPGYGGYPASYGGHYGSQPALALPSSYDHRHRSGSFSAVPVVYPGVPVVVSSSGRKKHRHSHSSSKRSRSSDPVMIEYPGHSSSSRY